MKICPEFIAQFQTIIGVGDHLRECLDNHLAEESLELINGQVRDGCGRHGVQ